MQTSQSCRTSVSRYFAMPSLTPIMRRFLLAFLLACATQLVELHASSHPHDVASFTSINTPPSQPHHVHHHSSSHPHITSPSYSHAPLDPGLFRLKRRGFDDIVRDAIAQRGSHAKRYTAEEADADPAPLNPDRTLRRYQSKLLTPEQIERILDLEDEAGLSKHTQLAYIPDAWDPRTVEKWMQACPYLSESRDQGDCDASYASAVASAFSDRLCTESDGNVNFSHPISTQALLSCCGFQCGIGCNGGYASLAWNYLYTDGAVSGGEWNSTGSETEGCLPYALPPCHKTDSTGTIRVCESFPGKTHTPICTNQCASPGSDWESSKSFALEPQYIVNTSAAIELEIYMHGSVTAVMGLYQDFLKHVGIYQWSIPLSTKLGSITVKLIGFNYSQGLNYWTGAVAWGPYFASDQSFFEILRGVNLVGIESQVMSAAVRFPKSEKKKRGEKGDMKKRKVVMEQEKEREEQQAKQKHKQTQHPHTKHKETTSEPGF